MPTPAELANSLSPEEFELALRAYIDRQWNNLDENPGIIMLIVSSAGYDKTDGPRKVHWTVGNVGKNQTDGEILSEVVLERNRRVLFEKQCTLRVLEHAPSNERR